MPFCVVIQPVPLGTEEVLVKRAVSGTITAGAQSSTGYCAYQTSDGTITIQASTVGTYSWASTTRLKIWPCVSASDSTKSGTLNGYIMAGKATQLSYFDINGSSFTRLYSYGQSYLAKSTYNSLPILPSSLTGLDVHYGSLTSLDVSNNTALTTLNCSTNSLTSLDVSNNTALTTLNCFVNSITTLDVSNNTALTTLHCASCHDLASIGTLPQSITTLKCYGCNLSALNFSSSTAGPTYLSCYGNENLTESLSALQSLFNSLPTVTGTHTIYIGTTVTDTTYDYIATGKGWTISRTTPA